MITALQSRTIEEHFRANAAAPTQSVILPPQCSHYFPTEGGRAYLVAVSNLSGDYNATVDVYDGNWNLVKHFELAPFTGDSAPIPQTSGAVYVYNSSDKASVNVSLYRA